MDAADSERAVQELNGKELDSRIIRVEKARRANGYEKTPGRCKILLSDDIQVAVPRCDDTYNYLLHHHLYIVDLGPPQVSAKFGTAGNGSREIPRNGGDRVGEGSRIGGGDRMSGSGDRFPPSYDRGGYQTSKDDRGYGGGGGYDRPAPIYRDDRGRGRL